MPVREPIIECTNVSAGYDQNLALENVSFVIHQGEYVGLIGPNGGGKSTLVKLLLGILQPSSGEIKVFGESGVTNSQRYRIGYVPQRVSQAEITLPATVEEVVSSGRTARIGIGKTSGPVDKEAVERALEMSGIVDLRHRLLSQLSGGQRQRVFIAQALAAEPSVLILDEPTVGVDMTSEERFYSFLTKMNQELGLTIILVSHDLEMVAQDVTTLLCLNQRLVAHGKPEDIMSEGHLSYLYGHQVTHIHHHHH